MSNSLAPNRSYFVTLTQDCLQSADGSSTLAPVEDSFTWSVDTGANGFYISHPVNGYAAWSNSTAHIIMDMDQVSYAVIENYDESIVTFDTTEFYGNSDFTVNFVNPGTTTFQISFYDADGMPTDTYDYTLTVY